MCSFVHWSSYIMFDYISAYICITAIQHIDITEIQITPTSSISTSISYESGLNLWLFYTLVIIIIIMSRYQHGYPWPFLATLLYRPLLPAGLQGYIPYQHRTTVCRFELVILPLLVHLTGSIEVCHLWVHPYFSSSVLHVWFV